MDCSACSGDGRSGCSCVGDKGHQVVALIARANLTPQAKAKVDRLLAADVNPFRMNDGGMTNDSFQRQVNWADYYRESQRAAGIPADRIHTYTWHFVDVELADGSLAKACGGFAPLPSGLPASGGPDPDCVVDKIEQFTAELRSPVVNDAENLLALKFLLHFVGDLHQPLHAADDHDFGGNTKKASIEGSAPQALHRLRDVTFVEALVAGKAAPTSENVAAAMPRPTMTEVRQWTAVTSPRVWAAESFAIGRHDAYGRLPTVPGSAAGSVVYALDTAYVEAAKRDVSLQLRRAGYRMAALLNLAFSPMN